MVRIVGLERLAFTVGIFVALALTFVPNVARAFLLSTDVEIKLVENVSTTWTTVELDNNYTSAVPVCTYVLGTFAGTHPNYTNPPTVTRIRNITSNSFELRIQGWEDTAASTSDVHCLIVDEGAHTLSDGRELEAYRVDSDATTGQSGDSGAWRAADLEDVSSTITNTYTNPVVFGQVITFNDNRASVFYNNDCDSRGNHPFQSGQADGICVGKHIGQINGTRLTETLGYIVAEAGSGTANNIAYELARGSDSVAGNNNSNSGDTYNLSQTHTIAVLNQAAEDGGNGGWAVLYGNDPLAGGNLDLAIDEQTVQGDTSRVHTNEQVYYWAFTATALTLEKNLVNDGGGTGVLSDFTLTATGTETFSGTSGTPAVTMVNVTPGTFTLSESVLAGYDASGWTCTGATSFTATQVVLSVGDDADCTITNDDITVDLSMAKSVDDQSPNIGQTVTFTLTVSNIGPRTATDVEIVDVVNDGFAYVPSSIAGADSRDDSDPTGAGLSWTINSLASGASTSVTFLADVLAP